jgi:nitroimidazol reductase NimA-like FMN-containing flavoprotein (pyridoxamine 5'-phosphate oxidase superfamily)
MREFLNGRHYSTLATFNEDGSTHLTPVWYVFEDECLFVETVASIAR